MSFAPYMRSKEYKAIAEHSKIDLFMLLNYLRHYKSDDEWDFWRLDATLENLENKRFVLIVALPTNKGLTGTDVDIPRPFVFKVGIAGEQFNGGLCFFNSVACINKYASFPAHHPTLDDEH